MLLMRAMNEEKRDSIDTICIFKFDSLLTITIVQIITKIGLIRRVCFCKTAAEL